MIALPCSAVKSRFVTLAAALILAAMFLAFPQVGSAHEHRDVGDYTLVVGFITEPAIQGDTNGITLTVTKDNTPVTGLADTLQAQVIFGDQTRDFDLIPAWNQDGTYEAIFIPTKPGDYTFRFFGQIGGVDVDETFTSSPEGFDSVAARSDFEFPTSDDSGSKIGATRVAMPLAVGVVVIGAGIAGIAQRRRSA